MTEKAKLGLQMRYLMQKYLLALGNMKREHFHPTENESDIYYSYRAGRHMGKVAGMEDMLYSTAAFYGLHFQKWKNLEMNLRRQARRHSYNYMLMDEEAALERYFDYIKKG